MREKMSKKRVLIIPCSGIGKSLGTVCREATYKVVDELRPEQTTTTCLALLTIGDKEVLKKIRENYCFSIDGCPAQCSKKNIEAAKGNLATSIRVTDIIRRNRNLKPEGVIELNHDGHKIVNILAEEIKTKVDEIMEKK